MLGSKLYINRKMEKEEISLRTNLLQEYLWVHGLVVGHVTKRWLVAV